MKHEEIINRTKNKLKDFAGSFQSVASSLVRYSEEKQIMKNFRNRRNTENVSTALEERFSLSGSERKALKAHYEEFLNLSEQKNKLISELKEIENLTKKTRKNFLETSFKNNKVLNSLKVIGWENNNINWDLLHKNWKDKSWDENHIFYPLLESKDIWVQWIKSVENSKEAVEAHLSTWNNRVCGLFMISTSICYPQLQELKKKAEKSKTNLEIHIGEKLMNEIRRVSK